MGDSLTFIAMATGLLLAWAGFTNKNPLAEVKTVLRGGTPTKGTTPTASGGLSPADQAAAQQSFDNLPPAVASTSKTAPVVAFAQSQLGKPYVFGAAGPSSWDCSGLTMAAYRVVGVKLPHSSLLQSTMGKSVPITPTAVQPGDLLFSTGGAPPHPNGHVKIAISPTQAVSAPHTGDVVKIVSIDYSSTTAVRRFV